MTERIQFLKNYQWEHKHHAFRKEADIDPSIYRKPDMPDFLRTATRLSAALTAETPVLFPDEIIAFTRTVPSLPMIYTDTEWEDIRSKHFIHENGNLSNISPGYEQVISTGLLALKAKLDDSAYHQAMRMSIDAVLDLTERYRVLAEEQGDKALADTLAHVPAYPARTFREALQSLRILHFAMWCEGDYHNTLGRFDQYMFPYFEKDIANGTLTEDEAFELLEAFFLSCNRDSDLYVGMQQGDNGQSIVLGGVKPDGTDGFNRLSELCLKASAELLLIDPKINLRVNKDTPLSVYEMGTHLTKLGLGFPQYENDDIAVPALVKLGYDLEDARNYAMAACWEFIIPYRAMEIPNIGALPFANITDSIIREKLGAADSMEALLNYVKSAIKASVDETFAGLHDLYIIPSPYMSLFFEGCLEDKKDITLGNRYNNFGLHGTGLAPAADMLAAVEQVVFEEKQDAQTLIDAMNANFEGYDALHDELQQHCPKMGNNDDRADKYAKLLLAYFADAVEGLRNERGGIVRAGTGSAMFYIFHANKLGATADGRKAGTPLPANYAPSLNVKLNGPLSLVQSFAKPDLSRVINGGPLTIEFSNSVFRSDEAITKVAQLVRSFVLLGGHQLQLNTVNREKMLDAQKHPENYRNLIVRVWGWSGYFVELDKCYQDHIIARAELQV